VAIDADLVAAVRSFDARIRRLQDYGLELQKPGWVGRLMSRKEPMAAMHAEEQLVRREVDGLGLCPRLIDAYLQGSAEDRQELRDLLKACDRFGGGPDSQRIARPTSPVTAEDLLRAFAFLALANGDSDWRDEKLWIDALCAVGRESGLDVPALLRKAATMASAAERGTRPSLRQTLLAVAATMG
jgi:hypothetical protein